MKRNWALSLGVGLVAAGVGCGLDPPEIVRPGDPDALDPEVSALLRRLTERVEASPRDPEAFVSLCLAYEANQLWREARDCFRGAARLQPDEAAVGLHLAVTTHNAGQVDESYRMLLDLAGKHPTSAPIQSRLAEISLERGELDTAGAAFGRLVHLRPNAPEGHAGVGAVLLRRGSPEDAVQHLRKAIELDPGFGMAHYLLGTAYRKTGHLEEAKSELAKGVGSLVRYLPDTLSPRLAKFRVNATDRLLQASELLGRGNAAEAAALLEKVVDARRDDVTALNNLAVAYLRQGRFREAAAILEHARNVNPDKFSTYLNLASLALRQSRFEDALSQADEAVKRAPEMAQPRYVRAQALAELGRFEEALEAAEQAASIDSNQPHNHTFAGDLCLQLGRFRQARERFRTALEIEPRFLPARLGLIRATWELGLASEAREALESARLQAPGHPQVATWTKRLAAGERP